MATANALLNADEAELSKRVDFAEIEYDVTDYPYMIICCCGGQKTLQLLPNEIIYIENTPFSRNVKRLPYGELSDVGPSHFLCCNGITTNLSKKPMQPGCFGIGWRDYVIEVAGQMRDRMMHRGDAANLKRSEEALDKIEKILSILQLQGSKLDALLSHMNVPLAPGQETMSYGTV